MPNFNGLWTSRQQLQASDVWPRSPGAPTSISGTNGDTQSVVSFTAPSYTGYPAGILGYRVTANPGNITATGVSSPVTITGLTNNVTYTLTVSALGASGYGPESSSVSVTPVPVQQIAYTDGGTYTFVVPTGLNPASIAVVCVGGGAGSSYASGTYQGGGGGGLRYRNNITGLTAGQSINVTVAGTTYWSSNGDSSFGTNGVDSFYVYGGGGKNSSGGSAGGTGTSIGGNVGGGNGGAANVSYAGGGGAGGYSGNGGSSASAGTGGGGGGGGSGGSLVGGGGGVGILGQGSNGAAGSGSTGGGGGSGGTNGTNGTTSGYTANGGTYGGGAGGDYAYTSNYGAGTGGAVRVIFSTYGVSRAFPSTNTGDL